MPEVTCPRCGVRQPVGDGAGGYTCTDCGASWMFAACENCGVRFHMRPGTTDWTCPECGHEHGSATMGEFEPEPAAHEELRIESTPASAQPGHRLTSAVIRPSGTHARSAGDDRDRGDHRGRRHRLRAVVTVLFRPRRLARDLIVGQCPVAVVDHDASPLPASARPADASRGRTTRLADTLKADAIAIKAEGDTELTAAVLRDAQGRPRISRCPCSARRHECRRSADRGRLQRDAVRIGASLALCARECQLSSRHGRTPRADVAQGDRAAHDRRGLRCNG